MRKDVGGMRAGRMWASRGESHNIHIHVELLTIKVYCVECGAPVVTATTVDVGDGEKSDD
jgi:hypothetical protein